MSMVYVLDKEGRSTAMRRVQCKNEDLELQRILERNPDLLPGDQIDPDDPRRWLLIKREMPVPHPGTGTDRWSVDFLFADQDGMPTFVECKRFADTRSRREVVGQMLEYAANGHHYWSKEDLREYAEQTASIAHTTLEKSLDRLRPSEDLSPDDFFEVIQQNLREGQLRIVFFLEESPMELRSVVDFLNRQMERSEVLLVEARQYENAGTTIVVPTLFGYTEEARMVKRLVTVTPRLTWTRVAYFADARKRLTPKQLEAVTKLYDHSIDLGCQVTLGTGVRRGSFSVKEPTACPRSLITCYSDGELVFNLDWLHGSEAADRMKRRIPEVAQDRMGIEIPPNKHTGLAVVEWAPKLALLQAVLDQVVEESRESARREGSGTGAATGEGGL